MKTRSILAALAVAGVASASALGDYTVTQGTVLTPLDTTLNFDEPGQVTGVVPADYWLVSHGVSIGAGDGQSVVDDFTANPAGGPWVGTGNSFFGNFGVFMNFASDLDGFTARFWDPSGDPSPFGGGMGVFLFNDGAQVGDTFFTTPAWGGLGEDVISISATNGMVFDEVRVLGFGFGPTTFMDDASWHTVPAPSSLALLALGGVAMNRRRR